MADVGLVRVALVCRTVAETGVLADWGQVSKPVFTQPQLLTILCLMRDEDWTFREAEVRLRDHRALRQALLLGLAYDVSRLRCCLHLVVLSHEDVNRAGRFLIPSWEGIYY